MKVWITEFIEADAGVIIGPYIKAHTVAEANRVALEHGLLVIGEIHELKHSNTEEDRTIH